MKTKIGSSIIEIEQTFSTNTFVSGWLGDKMRQSADIQSFDGAVFVTQNQTAGRGQGENKWESESGKNLTFSIFLTPKELKAIDQFMLSKVISLGIADCLKQIVDNVSIKWPNDIYVGDKKIAGILIENTIMGEFIDYSIVGIGLNVNQLHFLSDAPNPISLVQLTYISFSLDSLLANICGFVTSRYSHLKASNYSDINRNYLKKLYRFQIKANFKESGRLFSATIVAIDEFGRLIVELSDNKRKTFMYKEIEFVI